MQSRVVKGGVRRAPSHCRGRLHPVQQAGRRAGCEHALKISSLVEAAAGSPDCTTRRRSQEADQLRSRKETDDHLWQGGGPCRRRSRRGSRPLISLVRTIQFGQVQPAARCNRVAPRRSPARSSPTYRAGRLRILFQDDTLLPWKTAHDNVAPGPAGLQRIKRQQGLTQAEASLDRLGLAVFSQRCPRAPPRRGSAGRSRSPRCWRSRPRLDPDR